MGRKAISITAAELDSFNSDDGLKANVGALVKLGGTDSVVQKLQTSLEAGLKTDEQDLAARLETFGTNEVHICNLCSSALSRYSSNPSFILIVSGAGI
jgi:hypothetical protein